MFFNGWSGLGRVLIISLCAYAALILVLRVSGKRSLGKLNAFDLVVTVALGSVLATVLLSREIALAEGVTAFVTLLGLQWMATKASVHWSWFKKLVRSEPRLLVKDGRYLEAAMTDERVTHDEIDQTIRTSGIGRIEDVAAVVLETDGSFSVIPSDGDGRELSSLKRVQESKDSL